jgi:hypothetical protein
MATLRQAIQNGFRDPEPLEKERGFEVLRGRQDFQALLSDLKGERGQ